MGKERYSQNNVSMEKNETESKLPLREDPLEKSYPHPNVHIDYSCNSGNKLEKNMKIISDEKPFECNICKRKLLTADNLKTHMRNHTGVKPFKCDICKKKFSLKCHLKTHLRIHTGEKPYKGNFWDIKYSVEFSLKNQVRTHTGEKPFKCNVCRKTFAQVKALIVHKKIHERSYECNKCKRTFPCKIRLSFHLKAHASKKLEECTICKRIFPNAASMLDHLYVHVDEKTNKNSSEDLDPLASVKEEIDVYDGSLIKEEIEIHQDEPPQMLSVKEERDEPFQMLSVKEERDESTQMLFVKEQTMKQSRSPVGENNQAVKDRKRARAEYMRRYRASQNEAQAAERRRKHAASVRLARSQETQEETARRRQQCRERYRNRINVANKDELRIPVDGKAVQDRKRARAEYMRHYRASQNEVQASERRRKNAASLRLARCKEK